MTQVKLIVKESFLDLQNKINTFIQDNPTIEVVDIKYSVAKQERDYTCMIIYKTT